jgi:hypothetical protein
MARAKQIAGRPGRHQYPVMSFPKRPTESTFNSEIADFSLATARSILHQGEFLRNASRAPVFGVQKFDAD